MPRPLHIQIRQEQHSLSRSPKERHICRMGKREEMSRLHAQVKQATFGHRQKRPTPTRASKTLEQHRQVTRLWGPVPLWRLCQVSRSVHYECLGACATTATACGRLLSAQLTSCLWKKSPHRETLHTAAQLRLQLAD